MMAGQKTEMSGVFALIFTTVSSMGYEDCRNKRERRGHERKKCTAY